MGNVKIKKGDIVVVATDNFSVPYGDYDTKDESLYRGRVLKTTTYTYTYPECQVIEKKRLGIFYTYQAEKTGKLIKKTPMTYLVEIEGKGIVSQNNSELIDIIEKKKKCN